MQTFNIPERSLNELSFAYYRLKAIEELINDKQKNKFEIAPKWQEYLNNIHAELNQEYSAIVEKIAFQLAPFKNFSYCIDIVKGCINFCES